MFGIGPPVFQQAVQGSQSSNAPGCKCKVAQHVCGIWNVGKHATVCKRMLLQRLRQGMTLMGIQGAGQETQPNSDPQSR